MVFFFAVVVSNEKLIEYIHVFVRLQWPVLLLLFCTDLYVSVIRAGSGRTISRGGEKNAC